ncbi:tripartite motif-containing protein 16-like protein [Acipenser ruthenus]|uniref:tripartite motif-containing protein 16-like protein n=1 Tax=Acipenser ruthenus TaxID=7906 RepID=UPI00145AC190|nr:tripartite motif-containing protein 16-like protein [Acipenser ruthenus]
MADPKLEGIHKQLKCPLCSNTFTWPVTLSCRHNFCKACLEERQDKVENEDSYSCPECQHTFETRPQIQKDPLLNGTVAELSNKEADEIKTPPSEEKDKVLEQNEEVIEKKEEGIEKKEEVTEKKDEVIEKKDEDEDVVCDSCIETQSRAVKSCRTCLVSYCEAHLRPHLEKSKFQNHKLVEPLRDIERRTCEVHNLPLDLFCQEDWSCICQECVIEEHSGHKTAPSGEARKEVENELKQTQIELDRKVKAAETAISKLQTNATSIENSVQEVKVSIDQQFSELLEAVEKAKKEVMEVLESEERSAVKQAEGIRAHLEQKCAELKKTHTQIQKMTKNKNDVPFLQEYSEWKKGASDDTLPSVYIGLKDRLTSFSRVVSEASQAIRDELLSTFKNQLKELCKDEKCGIKTTVAVIRSPKHHFSAPEPKTRSDFLQYTSPLSFDPETTHRYLRLTEDNHKVTNTAPWQHQYPDVPERFEHWRQVLCAESFYLGRHYFEVDISGEGTHVGLTYKSIDRKGKESNSCITGNDFSWCLHWSSRDFSAWHGDLETPVKAAGKFTRIGIYVDYARGSLAFYGIADSMTLIHKYQAEFNEPLYPACWLSKKENMVLLVSPGEALPQRSPSPPPTPPSAAGVQTAQ